MDLGAAMENRGDNTKADLEPMLPPLPEGSTWEQGQEPLGLQLAVLHYGEVFRTGNMGSQDLVQLPVKPEACGLEVEGELALLCWCSPAAVPCGGGAGGGALVGGEGESRCVDQTGCLPD
jgi:hypothetical protein